MSVPLDVEAAIVYFDAFMFGPLQSRARLFRRRGLKPRVVMPEDWEVFAAILMRNPGNQSASGPDLEGFEVKSAQYGNSFEYQYHKNSWQEKLAADRRAGHIYISHRDDLAFVEVRILPAGAIGEFIDEWRAERPYSGTSQQRFRKSVSFSWVVEQATLVLRIESGEVTYEASSF